MITDEVRNEVLDRTDLVALIGRKVDLRKAGILFKGRCPFHDERSASFTVTPVRRTYHCFGCGVHGDAIRFVMETEALNYPEAVRQLAAACGVEVPESRAESPAERANRERARSESERLLRAQDQVAVHFTEALWSSQAREAQAYLKARKVGRKAVEAFRLGWSDGDKRAFAAFAEAKGIALEDLVTLGLVVPPDEGLAPGRPLGGGHLRFRERLMFPVLDLRGEVVGFGGRILDAQAKTAKYINSPETPVYTKGDHLYGIFQARERARREGRVVLCEGNVDVIMAWQAGFQGSVAAMGTALTPRQVRLVKRLSENVVCVMDGDAAGQKAAFASLLPFLDEGVQPRAVVLPPGEDPDSFLKTQGKAAFEALLGAAAPLLDLHIEASAEKHPKDPLGRAAALRALAPALTRLSDPLTRALYLDKVAARLEVPRAVVESAASDAPPETRPARAHAPERPRAEPPHPEPPPPEPPPPFDVTERFPERDSAVTRPPPWDAPAPPSDPPVSIPLAELQAIDIILQFPHLALHFERVGGLRSLTCGPLADFVTRLCEQARDGVLPNEERLVAAVEPKSVRDRLMERLVLRPNLTEERAPAAIEQATRVLERETLKRRRFALTDELKRLHGTGDLVGLTQRAQELQDVQRALKELKVEETA
ncbi:MAG: DNA primase [Bradymonadia bacterium]|jgi:DNA primase